MSELPERQQAHLDEMNALKDSWYPEKFWGFMGVPRHKVLLIGPELSEEERAEMVSVLPSFNSIFFLAGLDKETHEEDTGGVQRILMYGGTVPGWKWALGHNDWVDNPGQCGISISTTIVM